MLVGTAAALVLAAGTGPVGAATGRATAAAHVTDRTLHLSALAVGDTEEAYYTDNQRYTTSIRALIADDFSDPVPHGVTVKIKLHETDGTDDFCLTASAPHLKHSWSVDPIRWGGAKRDGRC